MAATARTLESIAALPGIERAGGATGLAPITAQRTTRFLKVEGRAEAPIEQGLGSFIAASPGFFRTLGTPLLSGREFGRGDVEGAPRVAIVSRSLAQRFFRDADAVGRRLRLVNPEHSDEWRTIAGVVGDVRYQGLDAGDPLTIYTPFAQTPLQWMYVYVRTRQNPAIPPLLPPSRCC